MSSAWYRPGRTTLAALKIADWGKSPPARGVEYRGDQHDRVRCIHAEVGGLGQRVQVYPAMRVVDAFGPTGGAGGVTRTVGGVLLDHRPVEGRFGGGHQVLEEHDVGQAGGDLGGRAIRHDYPLADTGCVWGGDGLGDREQRLVDEHHRCLGVRGHEAEILRGESQIHLQHDRTGTGMAQYSSK